jgi:hypothetical protein
MHQIWAEHGARSRINGAAAATGATDATDAADARALQSPLWVLHCMGLYEHERERILREANWELGIRPLPRFGQ